MEGSSLGFQSRESTKQRTTGAHPNAHAADDDKYRILDEIQNENTVLRRDVNEGNLHGIEKQHMRRIR